MALPLAALGQFSPTVWNFDNTAQPLMAASGPAVLTYRGNTGALVQAGTASGFGLPLPPGGDTGVLFIPTLTSAQGLNLNHNCAPNGTSVPDGWVGNYTIIMDVLVPGGTFARNRSLLNTNPNNANNADFFIYASGAVGPDGSPRGQIQPDRWHRVAVAVGSADGEGKAETYIDGVFVGGHGGTGQDVISAARYALFAFADAQPDAVFFGDNNGETGPIYVASMTFIDRRLLASDLAALGGVTAAGTASQGGVAVAPAGTARRVGIIAHRGDSGSNPENTLAAVAAAIRQGVEAVEMDVRLSSDGQVVLMHDSSLDRTTGCSGSVTSFTATQLGACDAGTWFDPVRFGDQRVPRLADALKLFKNTGVTPYLDVKSSGMGPGIAAALAEAGMTAQDVWLWAFSRSQAAQFNATFTSPLPRLVMGEQPSTPAAVAELRALNVVGLDIGGWWSGGTASYGDFVRANGLWLSTYTTVSPDQILQSIARGVDKMETDYVALQESLMLPRCQADVAGPGLTLVPDGELTADDVIVFINWFSTGNLRADIAGPGVQPGFDEEYTADDVILFINRFTAGCGG
jgi:glycerophosphoryl diester phosphodiesterase